MMESLLIVFGAILLMWGLLYFEYRENTRGILPFKTTLSLLFLLAVVVRPRPVPTYFLWLLVGLIFCLGGDVFLALRGKKMFTAGLTSFLLGHVCYVICFFHTAPPGLSVIPGAIGVILLSLWVFFRLNPHLGDMRIPVTGYIFVITLMVCGAISLLLQTQLAFAGRMLAFSGAVSFYISDLFVARDRFIQNSFINRLLGLPIYYMGQFLLAFSSGVL